MTVLPELLPLAIEMARRNLTGIMVCFGGAGSVCGVCGCLLMGACKVEQPAHACMQCRIPPRLGGGPTFAC